MTVPEISRRALLSRSSALAGAMLVASLPGSVLLANPAYADSSYSKTPTGEEIRDAVRRFKRDEKRIRSGSLSPNGWKMELATDGGGSIWTRPIPGTSLNGVAVRIGEVESVLVHLIRRFHYEVEHLLPGDVVGWRVPGNIRQGRAEGNLASGTAVRVRPGHYPPDVTGGFFPQQRLVIRDILAELDGVVRWGGDDQQPDESLFSLDVPPGDPRLAQVASTLAGWREEPGQGAGAPVDVRDAGRRTKAEQLERRQRRA